MIYVYFGHKIFWLGGSLNNISKMYVFGLNKIIFDPYPTVFKKDSGRPHYAL